LPSGQQHELTFEEQRAVVTEVGAGLRTYTCAGRDLVDGYAEDEMCQSGRGQVLVPWPNRLEDGQYTFAGVSHQLPITEVSTQTAIHGLARWAPWAAERIADSAVRMSLRLHPQPGYPFTLDLSVEYSLGPKGLSVRLEAVNAGESACPFGAGAHPYLRMGTSPVDALWLSCPGRSFLRADERGLPVEALSVAGTPFDFTRSRQIGALQLDHAFTDLVRDGDGKARVRLRDDAGHETALWVGEAYRYLMLFTGDSLPDVNRRSIAVEPMTCPPNAFRTGESLIILGPGESFGGEWGIEPSF
jgi:aldose 1-epimerase